MAEITLEDLKADSKPVEEAIKNNDTAEILAQHYDPSTDPKNIIQHKPAMQTSFRKMNIGENPIQVNTAVFADRAEKKPNVEVNRILTSLDSATDRIKRRVDANSAAIIDELEAEKERGLKEGWITPKNKEVEKSNNSNNIEDDDPYEDDPYVDEEGDEMEEDIIMKARYTSEEEITRTSEELNAMSDGDFEDLMKESTDILSTNTTTEPKEIVEEVKEKEQPPKEDNKIVDLPYTNPAVDFSELEDDDDPYEDDEDDTEEDDSDESESDESDKEAIKRFREEIKQKITPVKHTINPTEFTIRKKPIKASSVIKLQSSKISMSDWVLPTIEHVITMSELSGMEIVKMNPDESGRNRLDTMKDMYQIMYDHDQNPDKGSYEEWCKTIPFADVDHLQFALYKATFEHSNFIHCACEKCKNISLQQIPLMDMVKFENDDSKKKFDKIMKSPATPIAEYNVSLVQISDEYVFALRLPSIYNVIFEVAALDNEFVNKYNDLIDIVTYIDGIYVIDRSSNELIPISTNPIKGDTKKSYVRKIRIYNDILGKLSSDEYLFLRNKIRDMSDAESGISYKIPEAECPECKSKIDGREEVQPSELLFTRHQLGLISNT